MKKLILILSLIPSLAWAQQPPAYVPITIDQEAFTQITTYLGELPSKYANPLLNMLAQKQQQAAKAKADEDLAKAKAAKPAK